MARVETFARAIPEAGCTDARAYLWMSKHHAMYLKTPILRDAGVRHLRVVADPHIHTQNGLGNNVMS